MQMRKINEVKSGNCLANCPLFLEKGGGRSFNRITDKHCRCIAIIPRHRDKATDPHIDIMTLGVKNLA